MVGEGRDRWCPPPFVSPVRDWKRFDAVAVA